MILLLNRNTVKRKQPIRLKQFITGKNSFNPLTFDTANLIELWDGDLASDPSIGGTEWTGSFASIDLVYGGSGAGNRISLISGGVNGHNYLRFFSSGGSWGYATAVTPVRSQPTTQYIVLTNFNHIGNRYLMDDGVNNLRNAIRMVAPSNDIRYTSVASGVNPIVPSYAIGTFVVLTIIKDAGTLASSIQVNLNTGQTWTQASVQDDSGLILNSTTSLLETVSSNAGFAYIILRNGVDTVANQNKFINYLMDRFAL